MKGSDREGQALVETCVGILIAIAVFGTSLKILGSEWQRFRCERRLFEETLFARSKKAGWPRGGARILRTGRETIGTAHCGGTERRLILSDLETWR